MIYTLVHKIQKQYIFFLSFFFHASSLHRYQQRGPRRSCLSNPANTYRVGLAGSPKTSAVPSGSLWVCAWVGNLEWEPECVLGGLRALASDWVFREQRGVRKARQWSNRISSLWWMVCESSTDSSLSQTHTAVSECEFVCVCERVCVCVCVCVCVRACMPPYFTHWFKDFLSMQLDAGTSRVVQDTLPHVLTCICVYGRGFEKILCSWDQ